MGLLDCLETFLTQTLCFGICGRCGCLGDHFSGNCPLGFLFSGFTHAADPGFSGLFWIFDFFFGGFLAPGGAPAARSRNCASDGLRESPR